jgi:hypothetical protein
VSAFFTPLHILPLLRTAHDTASREFSEETLGMWGGMGTLTERIGRSYASMRTLLTPQADAQAPSAFVLKNGLYINFLVEMPYLDPLLFQLARDDNDACLPGADPGSATIRQCPTSYSSVCLSIYLSMYLSIHLSTCLSSPSNLLGSTLHRRLHRSRKP